MWAWPSLIRKFSYPTRFSDWRVHSCSDNRGSTVLGSDDKLQITAIVAAAMSGDFLFLQIIYAGKTPCCLPLVEFPDGWHVTYTDNH